MKKKYKTVVLFLFITLLHIKNMVFCLQTDEQYFMVLSQRLANGVQIFKECYDIHQTSAVFTSLLLRLKYWLVNTESYDMLYLKSIGLLVQIALTYYTYKKLRKVYTDRAVIASLLFYAFTPKLSVMPDYALMQYHLLCLIIVTIVVDKECRFLLGVLCGLLCIIYPPFTPVALLAVLVNRKKVITNALICIFTMSTYFLIFIRGNIEYVSNMLGNSMHNGNIIEVFSMYLKDDLLQIGLCITVIILMIVRNKYSYMIASISLIGFQAFFVLIKQIPYAFNVVLILPYLLLFTYKKNRSLLLAGLTIPVMQLLVGNQGGFICLRYLVPIIVIGVCLIEDKKLLQYTLSSLMTFLLPMLVVTSTFYSKPTELIRVIDGSLSGCFVDISLADKIESLKDLDSYFDSGDVLIMDSDSALYTYTKLNCNSPTVTNTPVFNDKFVEYYDVSTWPNYIIKFMNSGLIDFDDTFEKYVSSSYTVRKYKDALIFEGGESNYEN